jgi:hypothetical protein
VPKPLPAFRDPFPGPEVRGAVTGG